LRISGDDRDACACLKQAFESLADGSSETIRISALAGFEGIGGIDLIATVGTQNRGVVQVENSNSFRWSLTRAGWDNNAGLIEPFCHIQGTACFQWLDSPSDIGVLFSPSGQW